MAGAAPTELKRRRGDAAVVAANRTPSWPFHASLYATSAARLTCMRLVDSLYRAAIVGAWREVHSVPA